MPISREKFERGPPPDALVIEFLDGHPDNAYTAEELEIELRIEGRPSGPVGESMFSRGGGSELPVLLEQLARDRKIQRKAMDGKVYYCSTKPTPSSSKSDGGGGEPAPRIPAPPDPAHSKAPERGRS
jgi:hypothetical protein